MTSTSTATALATGHIGLNVTDLARSKQFYQAVFGFEVLGESQEAGRRFAFLGLTGKLLLTLWEQSAGRFETRRPGLHHLSFQVGSLDEVREFEARLSALDARFLYDSVVPHREGADSGGIFFEDPDGIRLEIYSPTGASDHAAPVSGAPSCGFF
jgi:catechol 2,3-dioxygenase-like lactoylglutathione lyase family enzyme